MDRGAWWSTVQGVEKSQTRLRGQTNQNQSESQRSPGTRLIAAGAELGFQSQAESPAADPSFDSWMEDWLGERVPR